MARRRSGPAGSRSRGPARVVGRRHGRALNRRGDIVEVGERRRPAESDRCRIGGADGRQRGAPGIGTGIAGVGQQRLKEAGAVGQHRPAVAALDAVFDVGGGDDLAIGELHPRPDVVGPDQVPFSLTCPRPVARSGTAGRPPQAPGQD